MPRIPQINLNPNSAQVVEGVRTNAQVEGAGVHAAVAQLGEGLVEAAGVAKDIYDETVSERVNAEAQAQLQKFSTELQNGRFKDDGTLEAPPPVEKHAELYEKEVERIRKYAEEEIGTDRAYRMFDSKFGDFSKRQGLEIQKNAVDQWQKQGRANTDTSLQQYAVNFVNAGALQKPGIQKAAFDFIDKQQAKGVYDPQQALAAKRKFIDDAGRGTFLKILSVNPEDAIKAIDRGEFNEMPADVIQLMRKQAVETLESNLKAKDAEESRIERKQNKLQKDTEEKTAKDGFELIDKNKGDLDPKWVQENKNNLSKEDYRYFLDYAAGRGEVRTNAQVYAGFVDRISKGQDVSEELHFALTEKKQISQSDYKDLKTQIRMQTAGGEIGNAYKTNVDYIKSRFVQNPFDPNPEVARQSADAVRAFTQWMSENPNATRKEINERAEMFASNAKKASVGVQTSIHGYPKHYAGTPDRIVDEITGEQGTEIIKKSYAAAKKAYEEGKITLDQFNRESTMYNQLLDLAGEPPQAAQAPR